MTERPRYLPRDYWELHPTCVNCGLALWRHDYDNGTYWCPPHDDRSPIPVPGHPPLIGARAAGPVPPPAPPIFPSASSVAGAGRTGGADQTARQVGAPLLLISPGLAFLLVSAR